MKLKWRRKPCGCVNGTLLVSGKVAIRCERHHDKPVKKGRLRAYFDEDGIVRRG